MDIDLRWGGDPNIILGVEAAMVASIPIQVAMCLCVASDLPMNSVLFLSVVPATINVGNIIGFLPFHWLQLKNLQVFTVIRVIFQLAEEIPCISAVVVALLSEVRFYSPSSTSPSFFPLKI